MLVNHYNITNAEQLDAAMNDAASVRWAQLRTEPVPERFDVDYLREVHRRLFADVLPFAGQWRTVNVQAGGTGITYCRPEFMLAEATRIDAGLQADGYLQGLDQSSFVERLAYHWGELTALHPMRDGNTRSQSAFVSRLAQSAGYRLDWRRIEVDELRRLRLQAMSVDHRPLADYLRQAIVPAGSALDTELERTMRLVARSFPDRARAEKPASTPTASRSTSETRETSRGLER